MFDTPIQSTLSSHLQKAHVPAQTSFKGGNLLQSSGVIVVQFVVSLQTNEDELSKIWSSYHV